MAMLETAVSLGLRILGTELREWLRGDPVRKRLDKAISQWLAKVPREIRPIHESIFPFSRPDIDEEERSESEIMIACALLEHRIPSEEQWFALLSDHWRRVSSIDDPHPFFIDYTRAEPFLKQLASSLRRVLHSETLLVTNTILYRIGTLETGLARALALLERHASNPLDKVCVEVHDGTIRFEGEGEWNEKNRPNGRFAAEIRLRLWVPDGSEKHALHGFSLDCVRKDGVPAYQFSRQAVIREPMRDRIVAVHSDGLAELELIDHSGLNLTLRSEFRPLLQWMEPHGWDYGFLGLTLEVSDASGSRRSECYSFKADGARVLTPRSLPSPSHLGDDEVHTLELRGHLSPDDVTFIRQHTALDRHLWYAFYNQMSLEDPKASRWREIKDKIMDIYEQFPEPRFLQRGHLKREIVSARPGTSVLNLGTTPQDPRTVLIRVIRMDGVQQPGRWAHARCVADQVLLGEAVSYDYDFEVSYIEE